MAVPSWLGSPLKWVASLGTGVVTGGLFWVVEHIGIHEGRVSPVAWGVVAGLVAKGVGWLMATYGPRPTNPPPTGLSMDAGRAP